MTALDELRSLCAADGHDHGDDPAEVLECGARRVVTLTLNTKSAEPSTR